MTTIVLTQYDGSILGPIARLLGVIMDFIFNVCSGIGIENIGLCIILFTIVVNLLMLPLTINQQKFSKMTSIMNPELQAITQKYKGKKDQDSMMKQQVEQQAVYEKYGVSPTAGCLPLLIQMPILLALYRVIYSIPGYVTGVKNAFMGVVDLVVTQNGFTDKLITFAETFKLEKFDYTGATAESMDRIVDLLYKFDRANWNEFLDAFPAIADQAQPFIDKIIHMNLFLGGINLAEAPGFMPSIAWVIPILAGLSQWYSTKLMSSAQPAMDDKDNPMAAVSKSMNIYMPIFSVVICITLPAGVGLYWVASSVVRIVMQAGINAYMNKLDMSEIMKKNIEKQNKKREKKGLPPIRDNANISVKKNYNKTLAQIEEETRKKKEPSKPVEKQDNTKYYEEHGIKQGSIASKARMVEEFNKKNMKK